MQHSQLESELDLIYPASEVKGRKMHLVDPHTDRGREEFAKRFGTHNWPSSHAVGGGGSPRLPDGRRRYLGEGKAPMLDSSAILESGERPEDLGGHDSADADGEGEERFVAGYALKFAPLKFPRRKQGGGKSARLAPEPVKDGPDMIFKSSYLEFDSDEEDEPSAGYGARDDAEPSQVPSLLESADGLAAEGLSASQAAGLLDSLGLSKMDKKEAKRAKKRYKDWDRMPDAAQSVAITYLSRIAQRELDRELTAFRLGNVTGL